MIERQKNKYGWEFLFLGANIGAVKEASRFGIDSNRAVNYECDSKGTEVNFKALSKAVSRVRNCAPADMQVALADWEEEIKVDYQVRHRR